MSAVATVFQSSHKLEFLSGHWNNPLNTDGWQCFKIGTCNGQWRATETSYEILSVINEKPGNGHFEDVLEWFENSCKRDKRDFRILEVWNTSLAAHLVIKRGFILQGKDNYIKRFK